MQDHLLFYILLLSFFLFAWCYFCLARYRKKKSLQFGHVLRISQRSPLGFLFRVVCLLGAWIFLSLFIMQPNRPSPNGQQVDVFALDTVEFLIDVSYSMNCLDTPSGTSRLARAKEIAMQIVQKMAGVNISLRAFAGDSAQIVPPTEDYVYFQVALQELANGDVTQAGTDFTALFDAIKKEQKQQKFIAKTLRVLLTDGEDTTLLGFPSGLPSEKRRHTEEAILQNVSSLESNWVVVALGSQTGAQIPNFQYDGKQVTSHTDPSFLSSIAEKNHGLFYNDSSTTLTAMTDAIFLDIALKGEVQKAFVASPQDILFPVVIAAIFLVLSCIIPQIKRLALFCLFFFCSAMEAKGSVQDTVDQAISLSRAGREDLAAKHLQMLLAQPLSAEERDIVMYDMGTALAKEGRYAEALDYFRQVEAAKSPLLFEYLAYNGALCSIKAASLLSDPDQIAKYLEAAQDFASRAKPVQEELQEALKDIERKKTAAELKEKVGSMPPKEIIQQFIAYLQRSIDRISQATSFTAFWQENEEVFDAYAGQFSESKIQGICAKIKENAAKNNSRGVQDQMQALIRYLQKTSQSEQKKPSENIQRLRKMQQDDMSLEKSSEEKKELETEGKPSW
jgi:hypothetical protein